MSGTAPIAASQASADHRWLVGSSAEPLLELAAAEADPLARAAALRARLTPEQARLVLEQVALRERGLKKFAQASRLFFTPLGLEQATDGWIAAYKARRFVTASRVVDLCCGIGGDLMSLAGVAPAEGVDRDPIACLFAEANCRAIGQTGAHAASVCTADVAPSLLEADDRWHIDPDRRPGGRRSAQAEAHDPPAEAIDRLLAAAPGGAVKLAPAAQLSADWQQRAELEWISSARQCRQLVAWFGPLAERPGLRRATLVSRSGQPPASIVGDPRVECPVAGAVGRFVYDPDPAVVAAGLVGAIAAERGLSALVAGGAYLTSDQALAHPLLASFAVLEVIPWDARRLKRVLRERQIGRLEVKQRGTRHDPAAVARELKVPGDATATLILYRRGKSIVAILAERIGGQQQTPPVAGEH